MSRIETNTFTIPIKVCLTVLLFGGLVSPSWGQEAPRRLLVAYAGLISTHTSVWLGEDHGFFKKHGLDISSVFTGSGSLTSQALVAGEAKLASTSVGPTAGAVGAGADLVIVAGTIHILPYQFWVLPQVRQPADLKGKRVAISTLAPAVTWRLKWHSKVWAWIPYETKSRSCRSGPNRIEWQRL
jgi:ABC-type nitrate/sulfonate/bicarbonate transport system substrate-binding protein